ncbi:MAG: 6-bladed beta-propeller, partial [Bacteroidales bacterium]|nr:6-bladed beta-propeller [Bacteroidales bacterium]
MFALNACQKESKYCKQVIDLDPFFKNSKELLLSEIASDVTYIPLETSPECLIGRIDKIISFDDKYYILDRQTESILVFDSTGKYLFKIAQIGNGPGE